MKQIEGHVFYLAFGYFISYLPYAILAKALSSGIVPGAARPVGGLVLLSTAALGQLLVMLIVLGVSGWSRFAREQRIGGRASSSERAVLFVCGGNQSRSAVAECIARAAMATARSGYLATIARAGVEVDAPGAPMTDAAYTILQEAGVIPHRHRWPGDHCRTAALIQQAAGKRLAEQFL